MKSVIIGASAGLGRALATELAGRGHDLYLAASDEQDLAPLAQDLRLRFGRKVEFEAMDLRTGGESGLRERAVGALGGVDNLFIVAGASTKADSGQIPDQLMADLVQVNFTAPLRIINALLPDLMASPAGNLVGVGSAAAARPRKNNSVYASCKAGLEFYCLAQRHKLADTRCRVQFYRIGYLRTHMVFGQKLLFPPEEPERAACTLADNLGKDAGLLYIQPWWRLIALVFRCIPWRVFKKLNL